MRSLLPGSLRATYLRAFPRRRDDLHAALADRHRYEDQIDRLHQRHLFDGGLHRLVQDEVSLATVVMHRSQVAKVLARTVAAGEYQLRPAQLRTLRVDGKKRTVFAYPVLDLVVHGVVAGVLAEAIEPSLSDHLYSYRSGVSWWGGVTAFARYLREHRRTRPDPRTRGLYVLRRDVDAYTDSIPLGAGSLLWGHLAHAARIAPGRSGGGGPRPGTGTSEPEAADWQLIEEIARPNVLTEEGTLAMRLRGVPTGQPISCVAFNVYLRALDRDLDAIPGAFYARYSDDLIFAHPDPEVVREADALMERRVREIDLSFNLEKSHDLYMTGAGRASEAWPEAHGTTSVGFLGVRIGMDGTVALGHRKVRGFLRDARRRAGNAGRATWGEDDDTRGRAVVSVINHLLDPNDAELQGAAAMLLARTVTDRTQLDALDHELARIVATAVTGVPGPAAFRGVPYRRIRADWGLTSLRRARDMGGLDDRVGDRPAARPATPRPAIPSTASEPFDRVFVRDGGRPSPWDDDPSPHESAA